MAHCSLSPWQLVTLGFQIRWCRNIFYVSFVLNTAKHAKLQLGNIAVKYYLLSAIDHTSVVQTSTIGPIFVCSDAEAWQRGHMIGIRLIFISEREGIAIGEWVQSMEEFNEGWADEVEGALAASYAKQKHCPDGCRIWRANLISVTPVYCVISVPYTIWDGASFRHNVTVSCSS